MKLTEDEVILSLIEYLQDEGWEIDSYCLGQQQGIDIVAFKENTKLIIEAKGAKASDNSPTKKREKFSKGQIKNHFGKAIVKILEEKHNNPNAEFAIAHPDDEDIKKALTNLLPFLKLLSIKHYWVKSDKSEFEE